MSISLGICLSSCIEETESPQIELTDHSKIATIKTWFEENESSLRVSKSGANYRTGDQELILPFFEKEPDWDKFHQYSFPDGREVYEINLENEQVFLSIAESDTTKGSLAERTIQNILFVKHPTENRFNPLIVRYYPDAETSKREFEKINYQMIDENWSGEVDLFTYDEHYFMGFVIVQGQIIATRYAEVIPDGSKNRQGTENLLYRCQHVTTDWYQISSVGGYEISRVCLNSTSSYSCSMSAPSGGGGVYSYGGGDGGGGGLRFTYNPPSVPGPDITNLRIEIDNSFNNNPYLKCILGKLQLAQFVKDLALFDQTSQQGRNITLKVGAIPKRPGYMTAANAETDDSLGPYNIQITINKNIVNSNSLELARIILHEMVHAELFVANFHANGSSIDGDFNANFNNYIQKYSKGGDAEIQHNYMAEKIVNKIGAVLSQVHGNLGKQAFLNNPNVKNAFPKGIPSDFYNGLAWAGLNKTDKWRNNLPERNIFEKWQDLADKNLTNDCKPN